MDVVVEDIVSRLGGVGEGEVLFDRDEWRNEFAEKAVSCMGKWWDGN